MKRMMRRKGARFDEGLYQCEPMFLTCDRFWDGGIQEDSPLEEKAAFYDVAHRMSGILKAVLRELDEEILIGAPFCEHGEMFAKWSNLKDFELFRVLSQRIDSRKCYKLELPEDYALIDLIVEANFRYYSYIALYLPGSNVIFQPSCHTEVLVYTKDPEMIQNALLKATEADASARPIIYLKDGGAE